MQERRKSPSVTRDYVKNSDSVLITSTDKSQMRPGREFKTQPPLLPDFPDIYSQLIEKAVVMSLSGIQDFLPRLFEKAEEVVEVVPVAEAKAPTGGKGDSAPEGKEPVAEDEEIEEGITWNDTSKLEAIFTGIRAHSLFTIASCLHFATSDLMPGAPFHPSLYTATGSKQQKEAWANFWSAFLSNNKIKRGKSKKAAVAQALQLEKIWSQSFTFLSKVAGKGKRVGAAIHDPHEIRQKLWHSSRIERRLKRLAELMVGEWQQQGSFLPGQIALEEETKLELITEGGTLNLSVKNDAVMAIGTNQAKVIEVKTGLSGFEEGYWVNPETGRLEINPKLVNPYALVTLAMQLLSGWLVADSLLRDPKQRLEMQQQENPVLYRKINLIKDSSFEYWKQVLTQAEIEVWHYDWFNQELSKVSCRMSEEMAKLALINVVQLVNLVSQPENRAAVRANGQHRQELTPRVTTTPEVEAWQGLITGLLA
jgi:hypothetical protein